MSNERLAIGLDLGGTKLLAGVVNDNGHVFAEKLMPVESESSESVVAQLVSAIADLKSNHPGVIAVGAGVPCTLDQKEGRVVQTVHLPLRNILLRDRLKEASNLPVFLDNDGNMSVLAEQQIGAAVGSENVVMLTIGTGIGGGAVLDGKVFRGAHGAAPEIGHMIIGVDGPSCGGACSSQGCLEAYVSGTAIARMAQEDLPKHPESALQEYKDITSREVLGAAKSGDQLALEIFQRAGVYLGAGLASIANIFDPEYIVIGGGLVAAHDLLLDPAKRELKQKALEPARDVEVIEARLGEKAGMIGAGLAALIASRT